MLKNEDNLVCIVITMKTAPQRKTDIEGRRKRKRMEKYNVKIKYSRIRKDLC